MVCAEGIVYPKGGEILSCITLKVEQGEALGILGENSSGKSLLLETLSTLRRPFAGSLKILGKDAIERPDIVRRHIGYVPDYPHYLNGYDIEGYLAAFARCYGLKGVQDAERRKELIRMMELDAYINKPMEKVPSGVLKRVSLARALIHQPDILIIDNIFSGLDDNWKSLLLEIMQRIRNNGVSIIYSMASTSEFEESRGFWNSVESLSNGVLKPYN